MINQNEVALQQRQSGLSWHDIVFDNNTITPLMTEWQNTSEYVAYEFDLDGVKGRQWLNYTNA